MPAARPANHPSVRGTLSPLLFRSGTDDPAVYAPGGANFRWVRPEGVCVIQGPNPDQCPGGRCSGAAFGGCPPSAPACTCRSQSDCHRLAVTATAFSFLLPRASVTQAAAFNETTCETVLDVADSNPAGTLWPSASDPRPPGTYWVTSPVPGECERGIKLQIEVVAPTRGDAGSSVNGGSPSSGGGSRRPARRGLIAAAAAALAAAAVGS